MTTFWTEVLGWIGSAILVLSLLQSRVVRLRRLNLAASLLLIAYNAIVGVWPMLAMNVAIAGINLWHLVALRRERHDPEVYAVVDVAADDRFLTHLLHHHAADIARFTPDLPEPAGDGLAFVVLRGDEAVGVVLAHDAGDHRLQVDLDYVVPRYRDFTPGEFVFRTSGLFTDRGFREVLASRATTYDAGYLERLGFEPRGEDRVLALT